MTAWSGLPLIVEVMAAFGVTDSIRKRVRIFRQKREFDEASIVTALVMLVVAGGEYLDDLQVFRKDKALVSLLGSELPSP